MTKKDHLASVAQVFNGKTPSRDQQRDSGHPVLKIKDVTEDGIFRGVFESFVDADLAAKYVGKHIREGDILILNAAHNADYVGSKMYLAQQSVFGALPTGEWLIIRPDIEKLNPSYLYHWLGNPSARQTIRTIVRGIHLYPKDVQQVPFTPPSIEEQDQVAELLDIADALFKKRKRSMRLISKLPVALFNQLFAEGGTHESEVVMHPLRDIVSVKSGGTPDKGKPEYWDGNIPWVSPKDMKPREIWNSEDHITEFAEAETKIKVIPPKSILIVVRGMILVHTVPIRMTQAPVTINQDIKALIPKSHVDPVFLRWALESIHSRLLESVSTASHGTKRLETETLLNFRLPIPPIELQEKFSETIAKLEQIHKRMDLSQERIHSLFSALRNRLFNKKTIMPLVPDEVSLHV